MNDSTVLHKSVNTVFIARTCATVELLFLSFMFSDTRNLKRSLKILERVLMSSPWPWPWP